MVWAVALVAVLLLSPASAYAAEDVSTEQPAQTITVDNSALEGQIMDLKTELQRQNETIASLLSTIEITLSNIERYKES